MLWWFAEDGIGEKRGGTRGSRERDGEENIRTIAQTRCAKSDSDVVGETEWRRWRVGTTGGRCRTSTLCRLWLIRGTDMCQMAAEGELGKVSTERRLCRTGDRHCG